jgi:two-component system cell cycle response regulator
MLATHSRLLIVDDDPLTIRIIGELLPEYKNKRFATSGHMALLLSQSTPPDLILLDVDMPGMNGLVFFETMRQDHTLAGTPVIFVTALEDPEVEISAMQLGACDYVTKPIHAAQLRARVNAQFRRKIASDYFSGSMQFTAPSEDHALRPNGVAAFSTMSLPAGFDELISQFGEIRLLSADGKGVEFAKRLRPAVLLVDSRLPGEQAFHICVALRSCAELDAVPIVFIADDINGPDALDVLQGGVADIVAPKHNAEKFLARIGNAMSRSQASEEQLGAISQCWRALKNES